MAFLNPLFLFGGLAVAVPILLHLIRRHNSRKVDFPTLMFLRRIDKKTIRYQKLRHLLLLLLRVLAILFLVFAFMRPYREETPLSPAAVGKNIGAHILAMDRSMSMQYRDRWDRAKEAAADIIRYSNAGDKFAILEFSDRSVIRMPFTSDKSAALSEIENIPEPGDQPTRYVQALSAAEILAREAGTAERTVHLISDFQRNGWTDESREIHMGGGVELKPVDLGSDEFSNLAIQNVRIIKEDRDGATGLRIQSSIVEFGNKDRDNVRVGLSLDGRNISEKNISVSEAGIGEIEFTVPGLKSGEHSIVLEIDDSSLQQDNRFYLTIDIQGKTPVIVAEEPVSRGLRSASFFLSRALNVDLLSPYEVKTVSPQNPEISAGLLIWNDISSVTQNDGKRLEEFVKNGGGLVIVLGDSTRAAGFNRSFGSWLPVNMEEVSSAKRPSQTATAEDFVLMTDIRTDHPVFKPFSRPNSGTFTGARFYRHARIVTGPGAEILASFDNGDPALVSIAAEKGRVLIFSSSADDAGNDLPLKTVYAPFWQQILRFLESFEKRRYWLEVGDVIDPGRILSGKAFRRETNVPLADETFAVLDPAGQRLEIARDSGGIVAEKAGFYDIRTVDAKTSVAINTVAAESDLTHRNAEEMAAAWASGGQPAYSGNEGGTAEEKDRSQRLWIFLFMAVLLFLISESLLSGLKTVRDSDYERSAWSA